MKKIILLNLIVFSLVLSQDTIPGSPYGFDSELNSNINSIHTPYVNHEEMLNEDENRAPNSPFRYGKRFNVDYNFFDYASVEYIDENKQILRLEIVSVGAYAISLDYSNFYLPENAEMYVYNPSHEMYFGAYTSINNIPQGFFGTPLIEGDKVIIELILNNENADMASMVISEIHHDYRNIMNFGEDDSVRNCGVNVVCSEADPYQEQIDSASWLDMGGYICSGAMINNTAQDLTPYYWTADHCIDGENPYTFRFYFNYETNSCSGSWANTGSYEYGSQLLASSNSMDPDYALLLITDNTISNGIFYAGWNRSSSTPTVSCGVHHPGGDPKKINFDNDNAYQDTWNGGALSHWKVFWDEGGTEGGSSGSPVFDSNGRIVGQLSGGPAGACGETYDLYGKFQRAWNDVDQWLDPNNSGVSSIDGTYTAGQADEITVSYPNGGETLEVGSSYTITWNDNISSNVSIKLYSNDSFVTNISSSTSSDGSYTWTVPSSINNNSNYKIKITSTSNSSVYDYSNSNFTIANLSPTVNLTIGNVNIINGTIDIEVDNIEPIGGYQFQITDSPNYITITGAHGGLSGDYNFSTSTSETGIVLSFSFSGEQLPTGDNTLIVLDFEIDDLEESTTLCLNDPVFSDPLGDPLVVDLGSCTEVELYNAILGDINFDTSVDVLDVVLQVNGILQPGSLTSAQQSAADVNGDGVLNVIDVVLLVNIILDI